MANYSGCQNKIIVQHPSQVDMEFCDLGHQANLYTKTILVTERCYTFIKGNCTFGDLKYGEEDSISPSTLIIGATKG